MNNIYEKHTHAKTKQELRQERKLYKKIWWNDCIYTVIEVDKNMQHIGLPFDISNYKMKPVLWDSVPKSFDEKRPNAPLDLDYDQ